MLTAYDLLIDGRINPEAVAAAAAQPPVEGIAAALATSDGPLAVGVAVIAAQVDAAAARPLTPALLAALGRSGLAGKAAAYACAVIQLEAEVLAIIPGGDLDVRENAFAALAGMAARRRIDLDAVVRLLDAELHRVQGGKTSLAEHALRVLAIAGDPRTGEIAQRIIETDRFCDRFEVNRLRKCTSDGGRDQETRSALLAPWTEQFAEAIYQPPAAQPPTPPAAPGPESKLAPSSGSGMTGKGGPSALAGAARTAGAAPSHSSASHKTAAPARPASASNPGATQGGGLSYDLPNHDPTHATGPSFSANLTTDAAVDDPDAERAADAEAAAAAAAQPIDWKAFLAAPEAKALKPMELQLVAQIGPLMEELAARAIQAPLSDCNSQEIAALLLQVLPQALPPQHVQMALSPHSLNALTAVGHFLDRTGATSAPGQLVAAMTLVRTQMQAQMRRAGIIGGPDYSEPSGTVPAG